MENFTYIYVEFQPGGKFYCYKSPFKHEIGNLVLVNVYGELKVAKVVALPRTTSFTVEIKTIVGIANLLEDF